MRPGWKFALLVFVVGALCQCTQPKKAKTKLFKKLSHVGRFHKASRPKTEPGQRKNEVQATQEQMAAMQNPESLQPTDAEVLNNLQNYNKHYINNEMAAETALLADNGIDDDSALKISNMAALPNGMPAAVAGANAALKAKINVNAHAQEDEPADHSKASNEQQGAQQGGYDPNAYLFDANSWPEYSIHDSDYSHFHAVEMNNMNGENTDMPPMYDKLNNSPGMGYQNMGSEGGMEYPGGQRFPQGKPGGAMFNDEVKEAKGEPLQNRPSEENMEDKPGSANNPGNSGEEKPADSSGDIGANKSQDSAKPVEEAAQQTLQKTDNSTPAASDMSTQNQQQSQPQQRQQQQQQQQQQEAKGTPAKLAASVAQAAASLPPKAIASLVSSLVGSGKAVEATAGQGQGKIQKNVVETASQSLIPQDINPTGEVTQAASKHKIENPRKH